MSRPQSISRLPPPTIGNHRESHVFDEEDLVSPSSSYTLDSSPASMTHSLDHRSSIRGRQSGPGRHALRLDLLDDGDEEEEEHEASPKRKHVPNNTSNSHLNNRAAFNARAPSHPAHPAHIVQPAVAIQPYKPYTHSHSSPPSIIPGARPSAPISIMRNNQINCPQPVAQPASRINQLGMSYDSEFDDTFERDLMDLEDEEGGESQAEAQANERRARQKSTGHSTNHVSKNQSVFDSPSLLPDFPSDQGTDADDFHDDRPDEERDDIRSSVIELDRDIQQSNTQSINHILNSTKSSNTQSINHILNSTKSSPTHSSKNSISTPPRRGSSILQLTRINSPPERISHPSSRTQTSLITPSVREFESAPDDEDFDDDNVTVLNTHESRRSRRRDVVEEDEEEPTLTETDRDGVTQDESLPSSDSHSDASTNSSDSEPESTDPSPTATASVSAAIPVRVIEKCVSRAVTPTIPSRSPSPHVDRPTILSRATSTSSNNQDGRSRQQDLVCEVDERTIGGEDAEDEDQEDPVSQLVIQRRRERDKEKLAAMKEKHRSQRGTTPHSVRESDSPPKESNSHSHKSKKSTSHKGVRKKRGNMDEISYDDLVFGAKIGSGSYGEVFKGELWRQEVAIKRIRIDESLSRSEAEMVMKEFRREVRIMRHLRHPNVLEYLGVCETTHSLCLITEYCAAGSLEDQLTMLRNDGRRMRTSRAVSLALDIARGLNWLFHKGIIHRDLKTANVLIDASGRAKLADFGLSHVRRSADRSLKGKHGRAGTPSYTAPEVLTGAEYGTAADIFSYGIVLNEMLSGEPPYQSTPLNILPLSEFEAAVIAGSRPSLAKAPSALQSLITECWSDDSSLRPDVEAIIARLEHALVDSNAVPDAQTADLRSVDDALDQMALKQKLELDYARLLSVQAQIAAQEKRLAQVNQEMLFRSNNELHPRNSSDVAGERDVK